MFETYDRFLKAWFTVFPDCGVYGNNESRPSDPPNTFDVRQSIKSKYRFVYRYDDLSDLDEFPTKVERVITKPKTIAKTSSTITKSTKPIPQLNILYISLSDIFPFSFNHLKISGISHELVSISTQRSLVIDLGRFSVRPPPVICERELIL